MRQGTAHVLLVEDEAIVALQESRAIASRGYAVDRASTGEEAIDLFGDGRGYDMVVTDIDLGDGIDGIEAAKRMEAIRALPLVFLSTHDPEEVSRRAEGLGGYDFIKKGEGNGKLLEAIERGLGANAD